MLGPASGWSPDTLVELCDLAFDSKVFRVGYKGPSSRPSPTIPSLANYILHYYVLMKMEGEVGDSR